mmetsp:Transcript_28884/g.56704  ORF Transcript_28884/g.56704 Transcript_28884/m.56704 type:complete len:229 (+) Transcript_28884:657-1343(+)
MTHVKRERIWSFLLCCLWGLLPLNRLTKAKSGLLLLNPLLASRSRASAGPRTTSFHTVVHCPALCGRLNGSSRLMLMLIEYKSSSRSTDTGRPTLRAKITALKFSMKPDCSTVCPTKFDRGSMITSNKRRCRRLRNTRSKSFSSCNMTDPGTRPGILRSSQTRPGVTSKTSKSSSWKHRSCRPTTSSAVLPFENTCTKVIPSLSKPAWDAFLPATWFERSLLTTKGTV